MSNAQWTILIEAIRLGSHWRYRLKIFQFSWNFSFHFRHSSTGFRCPMIVRCFREGHQASETAVPWMSRFLWSFKATKLWLHYNEQSGLEFNFPIVLDLIALPLTRGQRVRHTVCDDWVTATGLFTVHGVRVNDRSQNLLSWVVLRALFATLFQVPQTSALTC